MCDKHFDNVQKYIKVNTNKKNIKFKRQNGITLLALVITVIIIIILATVTIRFAFGDDGIIQRAETASEMYANDTAYTDASMANVTAYLDGMLNGVTGGSGTDEGGDEPEIPEVPSDWDQRIVTPELSEDNQWVPVPKGFTASTIKEERYVNDGFVIKQGSNGGATEGVNEFVWIPVDDESLAEMYSTEGVPKTLCGVTAQTNVYSKLRQRDGDSYSEVTPGTNTGIREPDLVTTYDTNETNYSVLGYDSAQEMADDMVAEYTAIYESIKQYDGFYIGRYELTGTIDNPTVQRNIYGLKVQSDCRYELPDILFRHRYHQS